MEEFFERLGERIQSHILGFFDAIPNVLAAILWLIIGFALATVVKNLIVKLLKGIKLEKYLTKWGIKTETKDKAIDFIGKLMFFVVFLMFLPVVFGKLGISSLTSPINSLVSSFLGFIPNLIGAVIILFVGFFIAKLIKDLLAPILVALKVDALQDKAGVKLGENTTFSSLIANIVYAIIVIITIVQAINVLNLSVLTRIGNSIIDYLPAVISVIIVVTVALVCANALEKIIVKKFPKAKTVAFGVKVAIYVLAAFISLSQLNIAPEIVNYTFIMIIAALCIAFAVAFGIGGRFFAQNVMKKLEEKLNNDDK